VALASALLLGLAPLLAVLAAAVKATSPGDVLFRQRRIGKDGRPFTILKLRTMVRDAPRSPLGSYCLPDDPRITPLGRILRRTSLDELPQLVNVLRGDMSFVGPRPDLPHHVERYSPAQRRRLVVRPGITGWAQVNGRNSLPWADRIALDLAYLDGWTLGRDVRIVWRTIGVVLSRRGTSLPARVEAGGPSEAGGRGAAPPRWVAREPEGRSAPGPSAAGVGSPPALPAGRGGTPREDQEAGWERTRT
jgi:lipopolysaccharide/colanic/teichoic acid biosynthesis glycosyltransferase